MRRFSVFDPLLIADCPGVPFRAEGESVAFAPCKLSPAFRDLSWLILTTSAPCCVRSSWRHWVGCVFQPRRPGRHFTLGNFRQLVSTPPLSSSDHDCRSFGQRDFICCVVAAPLAWLVAHTDMHCAAPSEHDDHRL
jgi:hypothetical protein